MNKENCALKLVDEIILYYDARSKKYQIQFFLFDYAKYDNRILNFFYLLRISHHLRRYTCPHIAEQYNKQTKGEDSVPV